MNPSARERCLRRAGSVDMAHSLRIKRHKVLDDMIESEARNVNVISKAKAS
jgi:hypothetical protein